MKQFFVAVAILTAAGCGSNSTPDSAAAVSWADRVCASIQHGAADLSHPPAIDENADPQAAKNGLVDYLGKLSRALDTVAIGIRNAGPAPVANGQATVDKAMSTITETKTAVDSARIKLQQLAVTNPASFQQAIADAGTIMQRVSNAEGPQKDLKANPDLSQAWAKAPSCKQLDAAS